jgi:hypothetical protein
MLIALWQQFSFYSLYNFQDYIFHGDNLYNDIYVKMFLIYNTDNEHCLYFAIVPGCDKLFVAGYQ